MQEHHWATTGMTPEEIKLAYERIMSRAAQSLVDALEEIGLRLEEARVHGWLAPGRPPFQVAARVAALEYDGWWLRREVLRGNGIDPDEWEAKWEGKIP